MSVPDQTPYIIHNANGLTTVFAFEFYIIAASDLRVAINGTDVTSGFIVSGTGNTRGGDVTFLTPPSNGSVILLERNVPTYRLTEYQDNGDLLATTVNKDFDRLWMAMQRAFIYLGLALTRPLLGGPFNAAGYRITGISEPIDASDAVNLQSLKDAIDTTERRVLRVTDSDIPALANVAERAGKILSFDQNGQPAVIAPVSGSVVDVLNQFADPSGGSLIGTELGVTLEDVLSAEARNSINLAIFTGRVQRDQPVTVCTGGDSLTYGEDTVTGTQDADATPTESGRVHNKKRASTTYPQALQSYLQEVFTGTVTVINQGYSGDNTKMGFADWNKYAGQHLTILMYGTNDAAEGFSPYQSIADYIYYYEKIILREIGFGSGVVIMLPPQQKQLLSNTRLLDAYRSAARGLANKYGIPVIDGAEITRGFDSVPFGDNVHFKTAGYQKIAAAVSAFIIGKFDRDFSSASHGSVSSVRFDESPIKHKLGLFGVQPAKAAQKSPPLTSWTGGYVVETSTAGAKLKLAFYAETDDLIIQPSFTLVNATCSIVLDENVGQMQYELDDKFQENGITITSKPTSSTSVSAVDSTIEYGRYADLPRQKSTRIHVAQKGWHTLTMSIVSNGSVGTMLMTVWGYSFQSADSATTIDRTRFVRTGAQTPVGNVTPLYIGEPYLDNSSGAFNWYRSVGLSNSSWVLDTAQSHQEGLGSPVGSATPRKVGDDYLDKSPGAFTWYKSTGMGVDNWKPTTS